MAFKINSNNGNSNNGDRAVFDLVKYDAEITNPRQISETCIVFTLRCAGFSLYNMHLVEGRDGKRFVVPPSSKGLDGKYYNQYAVYLSDVDQQTIIANVLHMLGGEDNGKH